MGVIIDIFTSRVRAQEVRAKPEEDEEAARARLLDEQEADKVARVLAEDVSLHCPKN